ncbi:hypothetical protein ACIQ9E_26965 [Streptomyces sp. NPDC094448]|uniref:hypothetical protein n=1 Tax=Streptomyces sp. NPDC094448 TaxID=3366063 RepID=UPI0038171BB7
MILTKGEFSLTRPSVLMGKKFNGYLRVGIPSEQDAVVDLVVAHFMGATEASREEVMEEVTPSAAAVLCVYAERMAAVSVRESSSGPLERGIVAIGMALSRLEDPRDSLYPLAALNHASSVIGSSLGRVIDSVTEILPRSSKAEIRDFMERDERDKSLSSMGLCAMGEGAAFRYGSGPTDPS